MRREAEFWNSQSYQFHNWPNIKQTYSCAIDDMPPLSPFPSEQLNDHRGSTTPSIHASVTQVSRHPEFLMNLNSYKLILFLECWARAPPCTDAAQRVSATFADLQKLRVNTTQAFLVKAENSISKRMRETRGYLEFAVDVSEKQLSQPSEGSIPNVIVRLAEKALCIAKRWNNLQCKVKYGGSILSIFSKPCQMLPKFDMVLGIVWFASRPTSTQIYCFICRDLSGWFSWSYNCHLRYAHSSIRHWIGALPPRYVAPFLVAYAFLGSCRLRSSCICSRPGFSLVVLNENWYHYRGESNIKLIYWSRCWEKCCSLIWLRFLYKYGFRSYIFLFSSCNTSYCPCIAY